MQALDPASDRAWNRELIALAAGGVLAGLTAGGLQLIAGAQHGPEMAALSFGAVLGLGANLSDAREGSSTLRLVLGVMSGVAMAILATSQPIVASVVGGLGLGAAFSLHHGNSTAERGLVWLAYAGALAAAWYTSSVLLTLDALTSLPPVMAFIAQASIWSVFLMFASGVKHLDWDSDAVLEEFKIARGAVDTQGREELDAARETYQRVLREIDRESQQSVKDRSLGIAQEVARSFIALVRRASELRAAVARTPLEPLERRTGELEMRIRKSRDRALQKELTAALGEVVEQIRTRRRLEAASVRLEARQQRMLTALERLHVTLVQNDALSATEDGGVGLALDELERLTDEVNLGNLSVEALCAPEDEEGAPEEMDAEVSAELEALLREARGHKVTWAEAGRTRAEAGAGEEVVLDTEPAQDVEEVTEEATEEVEATARG